jgi:hypothetical protein
MVTGQGQSAHQVALVSSSPLGNSALMAHYIKKPDVDEMIGVPVSGENLVCPRLLPARESSSPASHSASDHEPIEWPEWSDLREAPAPRNFRSGSWSPQGQRWSEPACVAHSRPLQATARPLALHMMKDRTASAARPTGTSSMCGWR